MSDATAVPELDLGEHQGTKGFQGKPLLNLQTKRGCTYLPDTDSSTYPPAVNQLVSKAMT